MSRWNGKPLRDIRDAEGLSRRELMFRIKANETTAPAERTITRWEEGTTSPDADDLAALAVALGCTVQDFFVLDEEVA